VSDHVDDSPETIRARAREEILERIESWVDTWDGYEGARVTAYHVVVEVLTLEGGRTMVEIGDDQSSRHTAMGLLFAALHDPRWLDSERE
jgi:hypothetical protein